MPESRTSLRITELPVGKWTQDYKEFLDDLLKGDGSKAGQENLLKNYSEHHTGNEGLFSCIFSRRMFLGFFSFFFSFETAAQSWSSAGIGGGKENARPKYTFSLLSPLFFKAPIYPVS